MARFLTKSIGRETQELRGSCGLCTSRRLSPAKGSRVSTVVSGVDPPILTCRDDDRTVVKQYREDERPDTGSVFEDSDYEGDPEQADESATEGQDDENEEGEGEGDENGGDENEEDETEEDETEEDEQEALPVLSLGSLSR